MEIKIDLNVAIWNVCS